VEQHSVNNHPQQAVPNQTHAYKYKIVVTYAIKQRFWDGNTHSEHTTQAASSKRSLNEPKVERQGKFYVLSIQSRGKHLSNAQGTTITTLMQENFHGKSTTILVK
jgi:hypothetical protein